MNWQEEKYVIRAAINSMSTVYDMLNPINVGDPLIRPRMVDIIDRLKERLNFLEGQG